MLITCNWMSQSRAQWACSGQPHCVFDYEGSVFFLVCHTSCLCSHFICPRQVHVRPLVSVLRISPDFQILVSSRFVLFFFFLPVLCAGLLIVLIRMAPFTVQCTSPFSELLCHHRLESSWGTDSLIQSLIT